jgi:hypothetical protein
MNLKKIISLITVLLAIFSMAVGAFLYNYFIHKNNNQVACTMEAKICPDGSSVSRTGPNCEFTTCPDITTNWKTYNGNGFELKYPEIFTGTTWRAENWPLVVSKLNGKMTIDEACGQTSSTGPSIFNSISTSDVNNFVLLVSSDVGAGQLYTDYCYVQNINNYNYVIHFLIHSTNGCGNGNCGPYCGTSNDQACKNFDMQKEIVQPIENILSTFKLIK